VGEVEEVIFYLEKWKRRRETVSSQGEEGRRTQPPVACDQNLDWPQVREDIAKGRSGSRNSRWRRKKIPSAGGKERI